jgi:hypothetical protein
MLVLEQGSALNENLTSATLHSLGAGCPELVSLQWVSHIDTDDAAILPV